MEGRCGCHGGEIVKLTAEEWHDVADLCEQGACQAADAGETHKHKACDKAVRWMHQLAMKATGYGLDAEEKEKQKQLI